MRLVIIECNSTIQEIAETMADKRVSALVLVDSGKPVGLLTERSRKTGMREGLLVKI